MKLTLLLRAFNDHELDYQVFGPKDAEIKRITDDSRQVKNNCLFVAIKGMNVNAHNYIENAIKKGAIAVVGEEDIKISHKDVSYIKVGNSRKALSILASCWYGDPSAKLRMVGITGTKGKTTTAHVLYHILSSAGLKVGLVSSVAAIIGKKHSDTGLHVTNPEPLVLNKFLKQMVDRKCTAAILEVTSHGLDQQRVYGVNFDIGILVNVRPEHLDYHKNMLNYKITKAKLLMSSKVSVLNKDDENYEFIRKYTSKYSKMISFGHETADYTIKDITTEKEIEFDIFNKGKSVRIKSNMVGKYNIENIVAAIVAARHMKIEWSIIKKSLESIPAIPGRLEKIDNVKGINIYIDFAHTPDSLEAVLKHLRKVTSKKLISVFGCASERDILKRPKMGRISAQNADVSVFTSEDPRKEDATKIIEDIANGAKATKAVDVGEKDVSDYQINNKHLYLRIPERGDAITFAINKIAKKGDTVVICGKGHEKSMSYNGVEYPWSDKKAVKLAMQGETLKIER